MKRVPPDVLVVDDRPENLFTLERLLSRLDINVIKATSGNEALIHTLNHDFALVLMDVQMPNMDGFEVVELLRTEERTRLTPVIFITANAQTGCFRSKGYEVGAVDYLNKPIDEDILLTKVRIFLDLYNSRREIELQKNALEREIQRREAVELKLREMRDHLATLVDEKTKALLDANQELTKKMEELTVAKTQLEQFRRLMDKSNDLIFIVDPSDGHLVDFNQRACLLTGYDRKALAATTATALFSNVFDAVVGKDIDFGDDSPGAIVAESVLTKRDGTFFPVEVGASIVRGKNQNYIIAVVRDITDRKEAEERTRRMATFLKAILDATDELNYSPDIHTLYRRAVELSREKLGIERCAIFIREDDVVHGTFGTDQEGHTTDERLRCLPLDDVWRKRFQVLHADEPRWHMVREPRTLWKDQQAVPAEPGWIVVTPIQSSRNQTKILGVMVNDSAITGNEVDDSKQDVLAVYASILGNIIDRKQSEEKIREQAALLDITRDAMFVQDLEGNIIYWNGAAEQLYGWDASDVIGRSIKKIFSESSFYNYTPDRKGGGAGQWNTEQRQTTKSGMKIIVESRCTLMVDDKGEPISVLVVNTDITEKKEMEKHLMRSQRMESLGALAGGISHDLNNILAPVLMSVQLLQSKISEEDREFLNIIESSVNRGSDLVKQILFFARGIEGERQLLQIRHVIKEITKMIDDTFPKNILVETDILVDIWPVVGDVTQLYQVFLNLCVNARDAMPEGGKITITGANIRVSEHDRGAFSDLDDNRCLLIEVSDTGSGIPEDVVDRIFDPFFTTKEEGKGTGIGLSTTLGVVKSHGGYIDVASIVGEGTTFKIFLPAAAPATLEATDTADFEFPKGNGEVLLVIDDEKSICEIAKETLDNYGYESHTAANGADAVAFMARHPGRVKLVVTDMQMPIMDGPATVEAINAIDPAIKFIGMSGVQSDSRIADIVSDRLACLLSKPFTANQLLGQVHKALYE